MSLGRASESDSGGGKLELDTPASEAPGLASLSPMLLRRAASARTACESGTGSESLVRLTRVAPVTVAKSQ